MKIQIKKLSDDAVIPERGSSGAAGYDLFNAGDAYDLKPGERKLFPTDISMKIPDGYYGRIAPRSGLAYKKGLMTMAGVIDSDYLGNIGVILYNSSDAVSSISTGDRIAQIIIEKFHEIEFEQVEEITATERGAAGWGSTGK